MIPNITFKHSNGTLPKVSIIIPVYNTEAYLPEAIESIIHQTLREIEIIAIDDGSTDKSGFLLNDYAQKDSRILVVHQFNQHQGAARNLGLLMASGKYVYFMDSDDILDLGALEVCYELCEAQQLEMVQFDAESFSEKGTKPLTINYNRQTAIASDCIWNGIDFLQKQLESHTFTPSACLCFTLRSFLIDNFSGFPAGIIHEDQQFSIETLLKVSRLMYIPESYFKRRVRNNSTMTTQFSMNNVDAYCTICYRISNWRLRNPLWTSTIELYLKETLNAMTWQTRHFCFLERIELACRLKRLRLNHYITFMNWVKFWLRGWLSK